MSPPYEYADGQRDLAWPISVPTGLGLRGRASRSLNDDRLAFAFQAVAWKHWLSLSRWTFAVTAHSLASGRPFVQGRRAIYSVGWPGNPLRSWIQGAAERHHIWRAGLSCAR